MGESREVRVKKLALAFETGWEYMPGSDEAGSVLTDIFLKMSEANVRRFERIWEKQELVFQQVVPEIREEPEECRGALQVKASGEENGRWLEEGTRVYLPREQGEALLFWTSHPVQLTSARLRYVVYRQGWWAWLSQREEKQEQEPLTLFRPVGEELASPVFHWYFRGLCDGWGDFCLGVDFDGKSVSGEESFGIWTVSDGDHVFPIEWHKSDTGFYLRGQAPEFAGNLDGGMYEICYEPTPGEKLTEEWLEALYGDFSLTVQAQEREPDLCLTESGAGDGEKLLPFGRSLEEASCVYLACDRVMAVEGQEIVLRFRESFLEEEKHFDPVPAEYKKMYKKYPWLYQEQPLLPWEAEETCWEYFNGNIWRTLPGSEAWRTGCEAEEGERVCRWERPCDMQSCVLEGEEHLYIRLRLVRVSNAYATCYRKRIPQWEEVRFATQERRFSFSQRELPDRGRAWEERVYLGFDREVTPDNCWYTGDDSRSFVQEQIKGEAQIFGKRAFWVELTEKGEETLPCFLPNYIPIRYSPEEGAAQESAGIRIEKGTACYVEPRDMGILDAVCLKDMRCGKIELPSRQDKLSAEHYLSHFGRLLTPLDMELMLQERYPLLQVKSCSFRNKNRILQVELAFGAQEWDGKALLTAGEAREEMCSRLPEIREWLGTMVSQKGPLWMQGCRVDVNWGGVSLNVSHSNTD